MHLYTFTETQYIRASVHIDAVSRIISYLLVYALSVLLDC
jgi:hypothetical protein